MQAHASQEVHEPLVTDVEVADRRPLLVVLFCLSKKPPLLSLSRRMWPMMHVRSVRQVWEMYTRNSVTVYFLAIY